MTTYCTEILFNTKNELDMKDLTKVVSEEVKKSKIQNGIVNLFVPGATEVIIPIPLLAVSILGLIILRLTRSEPLKDDWLPEQSQLNQE